MEYNNYLLTNNNSNNISLQKRMSVTFSCHNIIYFLGPNDLIYITFKNNKIP